MLCPVYEKLKLYLSDFIKRIEEQSESLHSVINLTSLNSFLEGFGEAAPEEEVSDRVMLEKMPFVLDYLHR